ncbi:MAG TPA: malto-oligosyltrehalose synthase [Acidimicrobiales bacterium]|nr:malto-oligosyltrehalose synthase [Acidimicrobiales bacterium]
MSLGPTYRIQLTPELGFDRAAELAPRLRGLGIEHAYLSPIAEARPGSEHGYDGTDPTRVRAALGGRSGFEELVAELRRHGLGVLLDIVPNHLSTFPGGPWWSDVLRHGRDSAFAPVFDIAWELEELAPADRGRVVLPVLADPLDEVLARGELELAAGAGGETVLRYRGLELPLAPGSAEAGGLRDVLAAQHYRLGWWRAPLRNYRRFLTVDDLVGVRVEDPAVFERTHALLADLVAGGLVDAVRVDHVDGLTDPEGYLGRLRELVGDRPIVVEKILTGTEPLRRSWPVAGTTGYEAAAEIALVLGDPGGLGALAAAAAADGERPIAEVVAEGKRLVISSSFRSEVARLARLMAVAPDQVAAFAVAMPVYRTYLSERGLEPCDLEMLEAAGGAQLRELALGPPGGDRLEGVLRFQQLAAAAMAKGVEDTAWYRLVGLLPLLEVGGDPEAAPGDDGAALARWHERARRRCDEGVHGLVPGSTHDTKRSADVRSRLLALSSLAARFEAGLRALGERVPAGEPGPDALERRRIAETCLAMAPVGTSSPAAWEEVASRVEAALRKGAREAKVRDSWEEVDEAYESALAGWAHRLLESSGAQLRSCFGSLCEEAARLGAALSLAEVVLRSTLPGVPDCYQGDEVWNLALVDPDNRRPVDHEAIARLLDRLPPAGAVTPAAAAELRRRWWQGAVKLLVTRQALAARRRAPEAVAAGAGYLPLAAGRLPEGASDSVIAFARLAREGGDVAVVVATRAPGRLRARPGDLPAGELSYGEAIVALPDEVRRRGGRSWHEVLSGAEVRLEASRSLRLAEALGALPVAVLVPQAPGS